MAVQSIGVVGVAAGQQAGARALRLVDRVARISRRGALGAKSVVLQAVGLAAIDYAMFQWTQVAGFVAVGISFFALDVITGGAPAEAEESDANGGGIAR